MKAILKKTLYYFLIGIGFFIVTSSLYVIYLRWVPPLTTPLMLIRAIEGHPSTSPGAGSHSFAEFTFNCKWQSYDEISPQMKVAVIAAEDQQFAFHHGLDYDAIWEAF